VRTQFHTRHGSRRCALGGAARCPKHALIRMPSFQRGERETTTVLEMVRTFEDVSCGNVRHKFVGRRNGDIAIMQGSAQKAVNVLKWKSKRSVRDACRDAWA
jgi:UDP-glucose 4-epimerase